MSVRLAFAIAAHLEPEILLVDEVLAVGDVRFQKKCLNKMQDVGQHGRTILFVSHNTAAITRLCERVILLSEGQVIADGPSHEVVGVYLSTGLGRTASREWPDQDEAPGEGVARLRAVRVCAEGGQTIETVDIHRPFGIEIEYDVLESGHVLLPYVRFDNEEDVEVFSPHDLDVAWQQRCRPAGRYRSTVWVPGNLLSEGRMFVGAGCEALSPPRSLFCELAVVTFWVFDSQDGDSARGDYTGPMGGVVRPLLKWSTQFTPAGGTVPFVSDEATP